MPKEILVLTGSPRRDSNTEKLAEAFVRGAKAAGHRVEVFNVAQMEIAPCTGCEYCSTHPGECCIQDDMQTIMPHLFTADTIVFATPVYFYGMTAQLKLALDRMYFTQYKKESIDSCVLLAVYGDTDTTVVRPLIDQYKAFSSYAKWDNLGIVTVPGVHKKSEIEGHPALEEAEELGRSL